MILLIIAIILFLLGIGMTVVWLLETVKGNTLPEPEMSISIIGLFIISGLFIIAYQIGECMA